MLYIRVAYMNIQLHDVLKGNMESKTSLHFAHDVLNYHFCTRFSEIIFSAHDFLNYLFEGL